MCLNIYILQLLLLTYCIVLCLLQEIQWFTFIYCALIVEILRCFGLFILIFIICITWLLNYNLLTNRASPCCKFIEVIQREKTVALCLNLQTYEALLNASCVLLNHCEWAGRGKINYLAQQTVPRSLCQGLHRGFSWIIPPLSTIFVLIRSSWLPRQENCFWKTH